MRRRMRGVGSGGPRFLANFALVRGAFFWAYRVESSTDEEFYQRQKVRTPSPKKLSLEFSGSLIQGRSR